MRVYWTYFFAALSTIWVLLFYLGFSAGFANYFPILALLGSISLFVLATPIVLYKFRLGLILGLISYLLMLPYIIGFISGILSDIFAGTNFHFIILLMFLPPILVITGIYLSIKGLISKKKIFFETTNETLKIILAIIPIFLFIMYLLFYSKYWSWETFNV